MVEGVLQSRRRLPALIECLLDPDAAVRMRAADALEKVSLTRARDIDRYAPVLIDLLAQTEQQEMQWHLAALLPRLRLSHRERRRTAELLQNCLEARSSIVKTFALQGLFDLSLCETSLKPTVIGLLRAAEKSGTPAMKARSRKLLARLEENQS